MFKMEVEFDSSLLGQLRYFAVVWIGLAPTPSPQNLHQVSANAFAVSRAAVHRVQGRHHCPSGVVWARSQLPGVGLLPRHQHPPKNYCNQLTLVQRRRSFWTTEPSVQLELKSGTILEEPQTAGLVIQPFQTVAGHYLVIGT